MNAIKGLWGGGKSEKVELTSAAVPQPPQEQQTVPKPQPQQPAGNESDGQALARAVDSVNETKSLYDQCEARRMTAVINGKDSNDYSCEREFAAFKSAFDTQLSLEAKMPVGGSN